MVASSVFDNCEPRDEILAGDLSRDIFAAKLRLVVERSAPPIYQDPVVFFTNTFATQGLQSLIEGVFGRLTQQGVGNPVIRLETSFGGGKTHDEIALWHIAQQGRTIAGIERFVSDLSKLPEKPIQVAAVDGRDLDPEAGIYHADTGLTTYTLWGEIAYQIGQIEGYQLLRGSDQSGISPGTSVLERLIQGEPTLILLDEVARYLRSAKGKLVGNSDLAEQVVAFLFSLMDLAASGNHLVFVYSLASDQDTFGKETQELQELIRASARQEQILKPSSDVEVYNIVKQRMFKQISAQAAQQVAEDYLQAYRSSRMDLPEGCKEANYKQQIAQSYPFHPELFNLLTKKVASIPEFQRTRGALRLFAGVVRYLWRNPDAQVRLIHPHHLPVGIDADITGDLTSRLQRPQMDLPIRADIYNAGGRSAYAQLQDQDWIAAGKPAFSTWVARTIFLNSLTQGTTAGIRRSELNLSLLTPGVDSGFVERALERLVKVAWYLDVDPVTTLARFKEEPSINKIIAEEKEQVGLTQAKDDLRQRRDSIFAKKYFDLVAGPEGAYEVDDRADTIALCVIDFNEAMVNSTMDAPPPIVEQIFENTGESGKFRTFKNRLLFLLPNRGELDRAIDLAREYRAIQGILQSPERLNDLSESQQKQLKAKEGDLDLAVRIALTNTYRHLFYPSQDPIKAPKGLMHYTLAPQDSSTVKGKSNQQEVILKAIKDCGKIRSEDSAPFAPAYILQKVWPKGLDQWTTKALREAFAKNVALNLLLEAEVIKLRETLRRGVEEGQWDLRMGKQLWIQQPNEALPPLPTLEFSDRLELYRRGILQPPEPKGIELDAQVLPGGDQERKVQVRWRAKGAIVVKLYQGDTLLGADYAPSDRYEGLISEPTTFRVVVDYGEDGTEEKIVQVLPYGQATPSTPNGRDSARPLFTSKPDTLNFSGTPAKGFNDFADRVADLNIQSISELTLVVEQIPDYRKLSTAIGLFTRFQPSLEQTVRLQTGQQFVNLTYEGDLRGYQSFKGAIDGLLNQEGIQGTARLKLRFSFNPPVPPSGSPLSEIQGALSRNPVDRLQLDVKAGY